MEQQGKNGGLQVPVGVTDDGPSKTETTDRRYTYGTAVGREERIDLLQIVVPTTRPLYISVVLVRVLSMLGDVKHR